MFRFALETFYTRATVETQEISNIKTLFFLEVSLAVKYFEVTLRIHYGDGTLAGW